MCVIVDTNCLANVFDKKSEKHDDFKPVLDWVLNGKGKLVYGGTKYLQELRKASKYFKILNLLKDKANKVIIVNKEAVDKEQERISNVITDPDFDDPHLPAIVIVSKCRIICSQDTRSVRFVKDSQIYPKGIVIPKYYTSIRNRSLLCDKYIDDMYKPLDKLNKTKRELIQKVI